MIRESRIQTARIENIPIKRNSNNFVLYVGYNMFFSMKPLKTSFSMLIDHAKKPVENPDASTKIIYLMFS